MRSWILFAGGVALAAIPGWLAFPGLIYQRAEQPVIFSHRTHTSKGGMQCADCHKLADDGTYSGVPALAQCATCHAAAMGASEAEKNFIDNYVTPGREPRWLVYARQPENAWFPHAPHLTRAKLACETCHGSRGNSERPASYRADRISGYSRDVMKMDTCVACHERNSLNHACLDCHR